MTHFDKRNRYCVTIARHYIEYDSNTHLNNTLMMSKLEMKINEKIFLIIYFLKILKSKILMYL